ncbi:hypothetical protein FGO68_gene9370 [Halteria grandinella]|uniref:Uncharacterized protein n=1 Tax=Halteria grandinella TaxID=5974 RepID=A0A8J8NNR7_HALGN|nr:hypothetical protein FGO68_gene9370 [Halteria grandinella]
MLFQDFIPTSEFLYEDERSMFCSPPHLSVDKACNQRAPKTEAYGFTEASSLTEEELSHYYCRVTNSPLVPIREFTIPLPHYLEDEPFKGLTAFKLPSEDEEEAGICLKKRKREEADYLMSYSCDSDSESTNESQLEVRKIVRVNKTAYKGEESYQKTKASFAFVKSESRNSKNKGQTENKRICLSNGAQGRPPVFDNIATWFYELSAKINPSWIGKRLNRFSEDFDDLDFLQQREKACFGQGKIISQINPIFEFAF